MSEFRHVSRCGWIPDLPDHRDVVERFTASATRLPASVSLRAHMPPVYDQADLGSCTANAIGAAVEYQQGKQGEGFVTPSRLFIYYGERAIEGTVNSDAGAMIRDGIKVVAELGAPPESVWPYVVSKFAVKPPQAAYANALAHKTVKYARVYRSGYYYRSALAAGHPIIFGFTVYESFEGDATASTGVVTMPTPGESIVGGHAVLAVGYKMISGQRYYEVRNSWGTGWGDHGYFWMPEKYLLAASNLASDFWVINLES